jgi:hypothetical protein
MTAYSSSSRTGAPLSGRYSAGDTFTDAGSVEYVNVKTGSPGLWQRVGPVTTTSQTSVGVGAKNGATVVATEYGDAFIHRTLLTLTATPVTVTDEAGVSQWGGTAKLYDFPAGHLCILGAMVDGNLTLGTTGTIINTYAGIASLGTVAASATGAATLVTTAADILKQFATVEAVAKVASVKGGPVATQITESGALWYDGHTTAPDMYLNFKITDDATHTSGTGTFTGTVQVTWLNLGDN